MILLDDILGRRNTSFKCSTCPDLTGSLYITAAFLFNVNLLEVRLAEDYV